MIHQVSSALLEVLNPNQNSKFTDDYLVLTVDFFNVIFIATSNDINNMQTLNKRLYKEIKDAYRN